jgi:ubiquinone/menaquinone biosynthesis C-methylase UbiE
MDNNRKFWDKYVKDFESNPENSKYKLLGNNWRGENIFFRLLEKYSNPTFTALEIGCGGGRITDFAKQLFQHITATDVSPEMIRKASSEVKSTNITWEVTDGFSLDQFPSTSQDVIYSHDVFVHFSSMQVYPYLLQMHRILKSGGIGIVSFYNFITHFKIFKGWAIKFNAQKVLPQSMRHHFITEEMLRVMLADIGYEVVEIEKTNFLIGVFKKLDK